MSRPNASGQGVGASAEPTGLSQVEPQAGLAPSGFDPSRGDFAPTGWASADLGRAYFAVERARDEAAQPNGSGIDDAFSAALNAIENADCELENAR